MRKDSDIRGPWVRRWLGRQSRLSICRSRVTCALFLLLVATSVFGQGNKKFNYGLRVSFSSTFYTVEELCISKTEISDFTTKSEVSLSYTGFARLNLNRHYLQTEATYNISRYSVVFPTSLWNPAASMSDKSSINTELFGMEVPLYYGYYLQKQSPYLLAFFVGPKVNFILPGKSRHLFENFSHVEIDETIWPFIFSGVVGLNVSIRNLMFDISFEVGLNNVSRYFTTIDSNGATSTDDFIFNRRKNGVSFSIGCIF